MTAGDQWQPQRLFCFCIITVSALFRPGTAPAGPPEAAGLSAIADGVYVRPGRSAVVFEADNVANLGLVIGERCVAVIDTGGSIAEGRALDRAISTLTEVPVCYVINTHVHPDHMLGNGAFQRADVEFVGHENLPRAMAQRGATYLQRAAEHAAAEQDEQQGEQRAGQQAENRPEAASIVLPERIVNGQVQLDLGQRVLVLRSHSAAHTDNDLSVLDVQTGTLFTGDLVFLEHLPVLDGSINGWLVELDLLMREEFQRVVPGHGPTAAAWPRAGAPTVRYLQELRAATRAWIAGGGEIGAAQQGIEASTPERWQLIEQYHKRNVAAAFAELEWED